jgi:hypothetical protein
MHERRPIERPVVKKEQPLKIEAQDEIVEKSDLPWAGTLLERALDREGRHTVDERRRQGHKEDQLSFDSQMSYHSLAGLQLQGSDPGI